MNKNTKRLFSSVLSVMLLFTACYKWYGRAYFGKNSSGQVRGDIAKAVFKLALKLLSNLDFIRVWEFFTALFPLF